MKSVMKRLAIAMVLIGLSTPLRAQEDLAKQSQNPLGTIISVPFENNLYSGIGPSDATGYILNLKPVYPVKLGDWNLVNRLTIPIIYSEGQDPAFTPGAEGDFGYSTVKAAEGSEFGLGDINYQAFFSPAKPGKWIWGAGPAFSLPTATEDRYASDKWSAGISATVLSMPGNWVLGALVQNLWSFAGKDDASDVNKLIFQYFINYNLNHGWYLTSTPIITANWEADSSDRWTVPFGGGIGRMVKIGNVPTDLKLAAYWNAVKPDFGPDYSLQFTIKFLFPK